MKIATVLLMTLTLTGCVHAPPPHHPYPPTWPTPTPQAPVIGSITGTLAEGGSITITGSNFGPGPTLEVYDSFDGGTAGEAIPLNSPTVGAWTETHSNAPIYSATARSGASSFRVNYDGDNAQFTRVFTTPASEVFLSYWVKIPDGTPFPGKDGGWKKFSSDSSWKLAWFIDTSYDGSSSDVWTTAHAGGGSMSLGGNDATIDYLPKGGTWWDWDHWMRITVWLRADPNNPTGAGNYLWQAVSPTYKVKSQAASKPVFDSDGPCEKVWRYLNLTGWVRSDGPSEPVFDDVYLATGANAAARVEISDAATYVESKHLALAIPQQWSDGSITVQLPPASLPKEGPAYLYITDAQGVTNAAGFVLEDPEEPPCECARRPRR